MEFPEQDELVIVVIKKILPYGAFCILTEYNNMEAFLHISEIAPRWIKNIHEFVSEGQRHVAKIHRIDKEKNQVDVSLKRVSEEEKKAKLGLMKTEKRADKLLALALKGSKVKLTQEQAAEALTKHFGDVWSAFTEALDGKEEVLKDVDLPAQLRSEIVAVAEKNIRRPSVEVAGLVNLVCWGVDGVEDIKKVLSEGDKQLAIRYLGAPRYSVSLIAPDYKEGEKTMARLVEKMKSSAQKKGCELSFELQKSK